MDITVCSKCGHETDLREAMPHPVTQNDLCLDCYIEVDDAVKLGKATKDLQQCLPSPAEFLEAYCLHNKIPKAKRKFARLEGNCHAASHVLVLMLKAKNQDAKIKRGHWLGGDVRAERSAFVGQQHSWVEVRTNDGLVIWVDPTQFVFTGKEPAISICSEDDNRYDPGGYRLKEIVLGRRDMEPRKGEAIPSNLSKKAQTAIAGRYGARDWSLWTLDERFRLANTKPDELNGFAKEIFTVLRDSGCGALIPIDAREEILGD